MLLELKREIPLEISYTKFTIDILIFLWLILNFQNTTHISVMLKSRFGSVGILVCIYVVMGNGVWWLHVHTCTSLNNLNLVEAQGSAQIHLS